MTVCASHISIKNLVWIKVLTVCWLHFINYSYRFPPKGVSTSKMLSLGSGVHSVRQDLWFGRSGARTGGEAEVIMADSFFKDGINVCQLQNSLSSRGRGDRRRLLFMLELYLAVPDNIKMSFQLLGHPEPAVLRCVPTLMPPAAWRRVAVLP